jgi:hypothetical protein
MTIYLYKKTHKITGLKYLGITKKKDPHHYTGSGVRWKAHLNEYGRDYTTEILRECPTNEDAKKWGIYYSDLWNVAASDEWANCIQESGYGLIPTKEVIRKRKISMETNGTTQDNPSVISKCRNTKNSRGTTEDNPEIIARVAETKKKNNTEPANPDIIAKCRVTKKLNGTAENSPEILAKVMATKAANGTTPNNPDIIAKAKATMLANNTGPGNPEIIAKAQATAKERGTGNYNKITCPHCDKTMGKPRYTRWHGPKCKIFRD